MSRRDEIREKALKELQAYQVLMLDGHFDYGNGYHGRAYLNPHELFRQPSTIWRFACRRSTVEVGGRSLSGISRAVVTPPAAADRLPASYPS